MQNIEKMRIFHWRKPSPECSAAPQAPPWPRAQSPRTAQQERCRAARVIGLPRLAAAAGPAQASPPAGRTWPTLQLRGRPGRLEHGQDVLHSAAKRSGEAALWCALPGAGSAQPNGRNGGRVRPPDPGRNPGGRQHGGGGHGGLGPAAEARVP